MIKIKKENKKSDKLKLLKLFQTTLLKSDFMVFGEIKDIGSVEKILNNENIELYTIYKDSKPIGYCQTINRKKSLEFKGNVKINALAILPTERGNGYAEILLKNIIENYTKKKIKLIYLEVVSGNLAATKLYKKVGMKKVGKLNNGFFKNGQYFDLITYSINL